MAWMEAVVLSHFLSTPDIAVIDLAPDEGTEFPAYTAGAHIDVQTGSGPVASTHCAVRPKTDTTAWPYSTSRAPAAVRGRCTRSRWATG